MMSGQDRAVVLVTSRSFGSGSPEPERRLRAAGLAVERAPSDHDLDRLRPALRRAVAWVAGTGEISASHLDAAPGLRVIARYGVGVEAVDLDAAAARRVRVTNTPGANTESVADHTLALLLALLRGVAGADGEAGATPRPPEAREVSALTFGLVGLGRIGDAVARRLLGFGARVLAHDPGVREAPDGLDAVALRDLPGLLTDSDVLSLHRPGGETVVDAALLERVRDRALLVNTARDDLVDERAVAEALRTGRLGGYAADVGDQEGPLADAPNVLMTRHVASHTVEAIDRMGSMAAEEVLRALADEPPRYPVVASSITGSG